MKEDPMNRLIYAIILSISALVAHVSLAGETPIQNETEMRQIEATPGPAFDKKTTLTEYLRYATLHNAGLMAAADQWEAEREHVPQVEALPDPRFTYGYFIEEVETRVGPQRQKFGLVQTIPWFGKRRLRGDAATATAAAAEQAYQQSKRQLFNRVKRAYHEYWYLGQALAVTREHIRLVSDLERVARTRFKAGTATHASVIQAQVEMGKLDNQLRTLESRRSPVAALLNASLSRPTHRPLPLPEALPVTAISFSDDEPLAWLAEYNPDLQQLANLATREEAQIALTRRDYYPDISLGIDYIDTGDALNPNLIDSGKDAVMASVSVNLPLWYGRHRAAEREARLRKSALEHRRVDVERDLEAELRFALYRFRDAERKIDLYGDTLIPKAEEALRVTRQSFETGRADFMALIDAQRSLLEFQLSHKRSQADRGKGLAEVEMLAGREVGGGVTSEQ
jgi:cobalt-zinc-cadmium efflux system outer membrane protein